MHFHFWHVFNPDGLLTFFHLLSAGSSSGWRPFPILPVYLIMRCVCLIVYLESSTSFIDLVQWQTPHSASPNVILLRDIVCQMVTGRCHWQFSRKFSLTSFVMPLWMICCCLHITFLHKACWSYNKRCY